MATTNNKYPDTYKAGVSNIGEEEINYRRRIVGYGGGAVALALYSMLVFFNFPMFLYSLIVIPVFVSVHGFNEAKNRFSTGYGRNGKYNMNNEQGVTLDVLSHTKRSLDREYANKLLIRSFGSSLLLSIVLIIFSRIIN